MRRRLIAAAALTPLIIAATGGWAVAETVISGTPPFATSKVNDNLKSASGTTISTTSAAPVIVTVDTNHGINNEGSLSSTDIDNSVGILVTGGRTGFVRSSGGITVNDSYTRVDTDADGDLDGVFAKGTGRSGIRVDATGTFIGTGTALTTGGPAVAIYNTSTGVITIEGQNSFGILTQSDVVGSVVSLGVISVTGDDSGAIAIKGNVSGDVRAGATTVRGLNSTGITIDGDVGGIVNVSGAVSTSGYSYTSRPAATAIALLDSDDLGQGGAAMRVSGNVVGGLRLSAPPTASTTNTDVDGDGVPDATQGTGSLAAFGAAPALLIGSTTRDITLGNVGTTADTAYGLVNQGQVVSSGVYDNVDATALVVGGLTGDKSVNLSGGIIVTSTVSGFQSTAVEANATGMSFRFGATLSEIKNAGTISGILTTTNAADQARGISIESGAQVGSITNTGNITAAITGLTGIARAITDNSGTLKTISNTGIIAGTIAAATGVTGTSSGTTIAVDAAANTSGLAITQAQSAVKDAAAPAIIGDLYFGSGADSLTVSAGTVTGLLSFGAGADSLTISGSSTSVIGALRDDGTGGLAIAINSGKLSITNAEVIRGSSLTLGATSSLIVSADPTKAGTDGKNTIAVTNIQVADATIAGGAQVGLTLRGVLLNPTKLTVISASNSMTVGGALGNTVLQNAPFLYQVTSTANTTTREVYLNVNRRSTADLGFNRTQASAYDAVFAALSADTGIQDTLLAQTTQAGLASVYDQLLPDQGQGVFTTLDASIASVSRLIDDRPDPEQRMGGDSLWLQEVNQRTHRDVGQSLGSEGKLLGLVGGYESLSPRAGALGFTLAYYNVQDEDSSSAVNEHVVASLLEVGAYYRLTPGAWRFTGRLAGGYGWFDSTRRFVYPGVIRQAQSSWTGTFASAHLAGGYEARFGRYYARPEVTADWLYVSEGAQAETGGGNGFNLNISSRNSDRLTASALLTLGAQYGRTTWLRPEIRFGYRSVLNGQIGSTVARFASGGSPFTLLANDDSGGWMVFGFSLKGGTELSYAALEGDAELRDGEQRYNLRLAGRAIF